MSKQTVLAVAVFALVLGATHAAEPASRSGDQLRKTVSGKTVYLRIAGFKLPIHYSADGSMTGSKHGRSRPGAGRRRL
jgi:hypothetical protein